MVTYPTRDTSLLDPELKRLCEAFLSECKLAGLDIRVTQTHRSAEYQNSLFAQGRTQAQLDAKGIRAKARPDLPQVTKATAGNSPHEWTKNGQPWARAFDIVVINPDGKANWDAATKPWKTAGAIGVKLGLDWGGAWTGFQDPPHFQLPNWRTRP
ncbi:M15 family metallopeptidase [Rhizobacter sp. Root404]|uniref:M15 family metallopeptidase n=1 Tax=Rhizobacter sp. Root404 TaxID=1736528 RepID=UPI0006F3097B|nr:M15 family metallopeptidase [Rhizobacter sp. Root404]KQW36764.1 hypothetical protein ASC76_19195 [Rhizobacter sp. Root404]